MSLSYSIVGIATPTPEYKKMKAAYDACMAAKVPVPEEVWDFFDGEIPGDDGMEVDIEHKEWSDDKREQWGYELEIKDIPVACTRIRFVIS